MLTNLADAPDGLPLENVDAVTCSALCDLVSEAWLTRFWEQLTPAQRRRVLSRLRRGDTPLARTEAEAAPLWDGLGLPERNALVFGPGLPRAAATAD